MSRRKTRFTRMSRRKARSGTRKRRGGGFFDLLYKLNPTNLFGKKVDPNAPAATAVPPTVPPAVPPSTANAVTGTAQNKPFWKFWGGGARKTRHRRRRHRK